MKKLFVLMLLSLFCVGCVSIDNDKRGTTSMQFESVVGMKTTTITYVLGVKNIKEGKSVIQDFKRYPPFSTVDIKKEDLSELKIVTNVLNSDDEYFELWEHWELVKSTNDYPYVTQHCLYNGNRRYLEYTVTCPLDVRSGSFHFELRDKKGATRNLFGHVNYTLEGGSTADPKQVSNL